jgi:PTH1 family peptidyl-tRNA hydrolase
LFLLVGLGNPGDKYAKNRHNIGFMAVDEIARVHGFGAQKSKLQGIYCEGTIETEGGAQKCIILKPQTFMNESGRAVGGFATFFKINPKNIIVFYDEIELVPGKCRVKVGGGTAGHNGLRSISSQIGSDYCRVRLGVGHPGKEKVLGHVLGDFSVDESIWVDNLCRAVAKSMPLLVAAKNDSFQTAVSNDAPTPKVPPWLKGGNEVSNNV